MKKRWLTSVFEIAVTYMGTVVGAGFASGQEIRQFFSQNGAHAMWGIALTVVLFFAFGVYALSLGPRHGVRTFTELTQKKLGQRSGALVNALLMVTIFGLNVAMIAGGGTLLRQVFGWPLYIGTLICVWTTLLLLLFGIRGIILANSLIVPFMLLWVFVSSSYFLSLLHSVAWHAPSHPVGHLAPLWQTVLAFSYLGFNVGLSLPVLVPLGALHSHPRARLFGSAFGATGLGALMILIHLLLVNAHDLTLQDIPMATIASVLPPIMRSSVLIAIGAEIYSTLIANAFGFANELAEILNRKFFDMLLLSLVVAYAFAQVGFSRIVAWFYPTFGVFGCLLLFLFMVQEIRNLHV